MNNILVDLINIVESVKGGNAVYNADIMNKILSGNLKGPMLDFVLMNSAAVLFIAGKAKNLLEAVVLARSSISTGNAKKAFDVFKTQSLEIN